MDIQVTITQVLEPTQFVSKKTGQPDKRFSFIGKTNDAYPKNICFDVVGEDKFKQMNIRVGEQYSLSFDIASRQWNDKWFTSITCWRAVPLAYSQPNAQVVQQPQAYAQATNVAVAQPQSEDDLPF